MLCSLDLEARMLYCSQGTACSWSSVGALLEHDMPQDMRQRVACISLLFDASLDLAQRVARLLCAFTAPTRVPTPSCKGPLHDACDHAC